MTNDEQFRELWDLLNDAGDLLHGEYRTAHPPYPGMPARPAGAVVTAGSPLSGSTARGEERSPGRGSTAAAPAREPAAPAEGPAAAQAAGIAAIAARVRECGLCGLSGSRTNAVPGSGSAAPRVMLIGEGPGAEEDRTGEPFVGKAGKYLDKWLAGIGLDRERDCFITNIVKCRPPENRDPSTDESAACLPCLEEQVDLLRPAVILTLGRIAAQTLVGSAAGIGALRGKTYEYRGVPLIPTYHPAAVLRAVENGDNTYRAAVWEDLKRLREFLDTVPLHDTASGKER